MNCTPLRTLRAAAFVLAALCIPAIPAALAQHGPHAHPGEISPDSLRAHPELDPDSGVELLGRPARPFRFARWLDSKPLAPGDFRGKVVLIRFWTDSCRYCRNTLPAVETLRRRYADRGFAVLGAYHPGKPGPVRDEVVRRWAKEYGYGGPVAIDENWDTLRLWWLDGHPDRNWVSVSFLLDREGIVRWVHGGGEYHPSDDPRHYACDLAYTGLEKEIEALLR